MKFWEGAILVVGGIWLIGRMSRQSAMHPANRAISYKQTPVLAQQTNVAQAPFLVAGESVAPPISIPGPVRQPLTVAKSNVAPISNIRVAGTFTASPAVSKANPIYQAPTMVNRVVMTPGGPQSYQVPSYLNV